VDIFTFEQFSLPLCAYTRRTHHAGIEQLHWHPLQAGDLGVPTTIGPGAGLPCRRLSARGRLWTANPDVSWAMGLPRTTLQQYVWWQIVYCCWSTSLERPVYRTPQHRTDSRNFLWTSESCFFSVSWGRGVFMTVWFLDNVIIRKQTMEHNTNQIKLDDN